MPLALPHRVGCRPPGLVDAGAAPHLAAVLPGCTARGGTRATHQRSRVHHRTSDPLGPPHRSAHRRVRRDRGGRRGAVARCRRRRRRDRHRRRGSVVHAGAPECAATHRRARARRGCGARACLCRRRPSVGHGLRRHRAARRDERIGDARAPSRGSSPSMSTGRAVRRRLASVGDINRDSIESRPLVVGGDTVGRLVVSGRRGELLDRSTSDSLDDLAPVVGVVVQLVARTRELSESRARIAGARDEERRTMRRELHDGLGPALAGVALGLRAVTKLLPTRPAEGAPLVDRDGRRDRRTGRGRANARPRARPAGARRTRPRARRSTTSPIGIGSAAVSIWS